MASVNIRRLRFVAWIGLVIVLLVDLVLSVRGRGGWGLAFVMLCLFPVVVALVSLVLMPRAAGTLLRNADLLLTLALMVVAGKLLDWLSAAPVLGMLLKPTLPLHIFSLGFSLSLSFLLHSVIAVAYATWMTVALLELARTGESDPCRVLPAAVRRFWRVLGIEFIGWAAVMVVTSVLLLTMPVLMFFALVLMTVFAVVWNYATAAVLPVACEAAGGFWQSFRSGMAVSLVNLGRWGILLLVQMLLLGLVFFYHSSGGGHTNLSWSINVFWTGGYESDCRWYGKLATALHSTKLPFVETVLTLLFGTFAAAIKLAIIQRLHPTARPGMPSASPRT